MMRFLEIQKSVSKTIFLISWTLQVFIRSDNTKSDYDSKLQLGFD